MKDVVYVYRKTRDGGNELRHSMRSLKNLTDFDGRVFVAGDKEPWFSDEIVHIPHRQSHHSPYKDVENKIMQICNDSRVSNDFILMNDDIFITKPTSLPVMHRGSIDDVTRPSFHTRALKATAEFLRGMGVEHPLNYAIHAPMVMNKGKRRVVHDLIAPSLESGVPLLARTVYGNLYTYGGTETPDLKTYNGDLLDGTFISTSYFTPALTKLFSLPSVYEKSHITVYDDSETEWHRRYSRNNRVNGAKSYTSEILRHQLPLWKPDQDMTISTTNLLTRIHGVTLSPINVQYLHTYPLGDPLEQVNVVAATIPDTIFVVSYKGLYEAIIRAGHRAVFIPMTIDGSSLPTVQKTKPDNHIIYYGNITPPKQASYKKAKAYFESKGWTVDTISEGRLNGGQKMTQQQCWEVVGQYHYGLGVGRSLMEATAMGVKVIVVGNNIGGIVTNKSHHAKQVETNYNTRYATFSSDLDKIYANMHRIKPYYEDIRDNIGLIEQAIARVL